MKGWQKQMFFSPNPELAGSVQITSVLRDRSSLSTSMGVRRAPGASIEKSHPDEPFGFGPW